MSGATADERRERSRRHREWQLRKQNCRKSTGGREPGDPPSLSDSGDERFDWNEPSSDEERTGVPGFTSSVKWLLNPSVSDELYAHASGAGANNPEGELRFHTMMRTAQSIVRNAQANNYDASVAVLKEFDQYLSEMSEFLGINVGAVLHHVAAGREPYEQEDIYDL